jgi:hypothetical protein
MARLDAHFSNLMSVQKHMCSHSTYMGINNAVNNTVTHTHTHTVLLDPLSGYA